MSTFPLHQFQALYPNDQACLNQLMAFRELKCACGSTKFYPIPNRRTLACHCGKHLSPLKGTIFENSSTPLTKWFLAIYLISQSKHGVSSAELQRHLGVTYKCAYRINQKVRTLMTQDSFLLTGTVEADETYVGNRLISAPGAPKRWHNQAAVVGIVSRTGQARAKVVKNANLKTVTPLLRSQIAEGSNLYTDASQIYNVMKYFYNHEFVTHYRELVRGEVHTNTVESIWSHFKRALRGTYHGVSVRHLQSYLDASVFVYNHRGQAVAPLLIARAAQPPSADA